MTPPPITSARSAPTEAPLVRLTELSADDPQLPAEARRTAALLRQLPKPAPLSESSLARIEDAIVGRTAQSALPSLVWLRRLAWGGGALATAAASFAIGWGLHQRSLPPMRSLPALAQRAADIREVNLPGESQARLLTQHGDVLDFTGPGRLSLSDGEISLSDGRLRVDGGPSAVRVRVGGRVVTIAAGGSAQVSAHLSELVYVAAYRGAVTVSNPASEADFQSFTVPGGATWPPSPPSTTSAPGSVPAPTAAASSPLRIQHRPARPAAMPPALPATGPAPGISPPAASAAGDASLLAESQLLGQALQRLHRERDPRGALSVLDTYTSQFSQGRLRDEAQAARVDALMQLDRRTDALQVLDGASLSRLARGGELRLLRGELRAHAGRCREALGDFSATWQAEQNREGEGGQRALYGLATCRLALGERGLARDALRQYLDRYPAGRFSDAARDALSHLQ